MPTLHWIGKDKVINHNMDVPFKVLDKIYDFGMTIDEYGNPIQENVYDDLRVTSDDLRLESNGAKNRKSKIVNPKSYLGKHNDTAYYFHYEQDEVTTLDHAFLATMKTKAEQYVVYDDNCLLTKEFMTKHNIIFKKTPRDITRF